MKPTFFKSGREFRAWLETHQRSAKELLVGFYKKGSGIPSIAYPGASEFPCSPRRENPRPTRPDAQGVMRPDGLGPSSYSFGGSRPSRFLTK
jgi:hypothetical protein